MLNFNFNFEIQKYYQEEPEFNSVYSRNNLPKTKDGSNVINLDEYESIRSRWIALDMNGNSVTYFDNFGVKYIPKENKQFVGNENITTNVYRIESNDLVMCGYFYIGSIDFMLEGKSL